MELNELVGYALREMQTARENYQEKGNYLIDELNLEINVSKFEKAEGGIKVVVFNGGLEGSTTSTHKVSIKLKPKREPKVRKLK